MAADKWDVATFQKMLRLAQSKGPSHIRIVCGDEPLTYKVTIDKKAANEWLGFQAVKTCKRR